MKFKILSLLAFLTLSQGAFAETPVFFDPIPARPAKSTKEKASHKKRTTVKSSEAENSSNLNACIWYTAEWDYDDPVYGIYTFPKTSGIYYSYKTVTTNPVLCGNAGAVYADGKFFVADSQEVTAPNGGYVVMSMKFYLFDTVSWTATEIPNADEEFKAMDMAWDPTTDNVYGCFVKRGIDGYFYFGTLDITTGDVKMIRNYSQNLDCSFVGVAVSDEGTVYAINNSGSLYIIDKATGEPTFIADTGLSNQYMTSATYGSDGNIYFALNADYKQAMYSIEPTTGTATKLYDFYDEQSLSGLYEPRDMASPSAPAAPTALLSHFPDGTLSGSVEFKAPSQSINGKTLSGEIEYTVRLNGIAKATGKTTPGQKVTAQVTADTADEYTVEVFCSNSFGAGDPVRTKLFIGKDTPLPVENVTLTNSGNTFTLTWDAAKPTHGGYLDPQDLSYTVVRLSDNTIATGIKGTSFTETLPEPASRTRNTYSVTPVLPGFSAEPSLSNTIINGSYKPPYTFDFDDRIICEDLTLIDGNGDNKSWVWQNGTMHSTISLDSQADDYLILPPVYLKNGMSYRISFKARATNSGLHIFPERVALWVGSDRDQTSMSRILDPIDIVDDQYVTVSCDYSPASDGIYHFAVHACSDIDSYYLWIDDLSISNPVTTDVPASVSDLTVTPGADASLNVHLECTLPSVDMAGKDLDEITGVEISRDGKLITVMPGKPGETFKFDDKNVSNGSHIYEVCVTSAAGRSLPETCEVYVGVHVPSPVTDIIAVGGAHNGQIHLSWTAPQTDTEGVTLPAGSVSYRLIRYDRTETVLTDNLTDTEFVDTPAEADTPQEFVQYAVTAVNIAGDAETEYSNITTYGRLLPTPATESFTDGYADLEFVIERADDNASWTVTNPASNPGVDDADGDGGLLRFVGVTTGDKASFVAGNFDTSGLANPALVFHYLYPMGVTRGLTARILTEAGGKIETITVDATPRPEIKGWQRCIIPIPGNPVKTQFVLIGENFEELSSTFFIDAIQLIDLPTPNVSLNLFDLPQIVEAEEPFTLTAYVENAGARDLEATVTLRRNGADIDSQKVSLKVGENSAVNFTQTVGAVNVEDVTFQVVATTPDDKVESDNASEVVAVGVHHNIYPAPGRPWAQILETGTLLTWNTPDIGTNEPQQVVDGVEDYVPFSIGVRGGELVDDYLGEWTSVDADGDYTLGIGHGNTPIPNASVPKAFMAFSREKSLMEGEAWIPYEGDGMFVAFAAIADSGMGNDDWLISPLLPGTPQTIKFMARSATDLYGFESFEILGSKEGKDLSSFRRISVENAVPAEWTQYTANLSAGTKYFAIRCISSNVFALCVDNIEFTKVGLKGSGLEIEGYNIYRDGVFLTKADANATSFTDTKPGVNTSTRYDITTLYNRGESRPMNCLATYESGMTVTSTDMISISTAHNRIIIDGAEGLEIIIATPDGKVIYSGECVSPTFELDTPAGIYLVRAGANSGKLIVR